MHNILKYICGLTILCISFNSYSQTCDTLGFQNIFWFKGLDNVNKSNSFGIQKIIEDKDGDVITAGNMTFHETIERTRLLITKTTKKGNILWAKTFEMGVASVFLDLKLSQDDTYIIDVWAISGGEGQILILNLNSDGGIIWSSLSTTNILLRNIIQLRDGSFVLQGNDGGMPGRGSVVCHLGKQGKQLWTKKFFVGSHLGDAWGVLELHDGNILIAGIDHYRFSPNLMYPSTRYYLRKLNIKTGDEIWSRFYVPKDSAIGIDFFGNLHELSDHSFHVHLGFDFTAKNSFGNIYYGFDSLGNYLYGKKIKAVSPFNYLDAYYADTDGNNSDLFYGSVSGNLILFKIKSDSVVWQQNYHSSSSAGVLHEFTTAATGQRNLLIGGNFASTNLSTNTNKTEFQNYLIKTDLSRNTNCSDNFTTPLTVENADRLFRFTTSWTEPSLDLGFEYKEPLTADLLPYQIRDCLPVNSCCRDTTLYIDTSVCKNNVFTLPDNTTVKDEGIYHSHFITQNGCDSVIFTSLTQISQPKITLAKDTCLGEASSLILMLHNNGVTKYLWQNGSTDSTFTVRQPGLYWVKAITACGNNADSIMVYDKCDLPVYISNAFTPNADGVNDVFSIGNMRDQQLIDFTIYNRFGQKIFTTKDPSKGWDGKINGKEQPISTFVYLIRYKDFSNKLQYIKGIVNLLK